MKLGAIALLALAQLVSGGEECETAGLVYVPGCSTPDAGHNPPPLFAFASPNAFDGYAAYAGLPVSDGCHNPTTVTGTKGEALTFTRDTARFCPTSANEATGVMCAGGGPDTPEVCITTADGVRGMKVWPAAATNLLLRSEEIDNAAWANTGSPTVTADFYAAPYAAGTPMEKVAGAAFVGRDQTVATTSQTRHTCSMWVRCDTGTCSPRINIIGTGNSAGDATCILSATTTPQRFSCTSGAAFGVGITAATCRYDIGAAGATGGFGGAQYEVSALVMSPYVKTTSASATRNAEVASFAVTGNETQGSAAITYVPEFTAASGINGWLMGWRGNSRAMYFQGANLLSYDGTANPSVANGFTAHTASRKYNFWTAGASASNLNGSTAWTMSADGLDDMDTVPLRLGEQSAIITGTGGGLVSNVCLDTSTTRCR